MFRRRPRISRREMLDSVPRLNPAVRWEELDTGRILAVFPRNTRGLARVVTGLFAAPAWSQILLDDIGTKVVRQVDGTRTVRELIGFVAKTFQLNRKEAEVALVKYMETLGRRNLVGFEVRPKPEGR